MTFSGNVDNGPRNQWVTFDLHVKLCSVHLRAQGLLTIRLSELMFIVPRPSNLITTKCFTPKAVALPADCDWFFHLVSLQFLIAKGDFQLSDFTCLDICAVTYLMGRLLNPLAAHLRVLLNWQFRFQSFVNSFVAIRFMQIGFYTELPMLIEGFLYNNNLAVWCWNPGSGLRSVLLYWSNVLIPVWYIALVL